MLFKIIDNISWLFLDKLLRMGVGLLVGVWVARYLGPEQFGLYNYALAFVGLFGAIATLGLKEIIVRDLVNSPEEAPNVLGTGFKLRLLGGLVAFIIVLISINILRPDDELSKIIIAIIGFSLIFKASDVIRYWFEARVESKFIVWIENGVFLFVAATKVALILSKAPLLFFVFVYSFEAFLVALSLFILYNSKVSPIALWKSNLRLAKRLLNDSYPLILSSIAVALFMRIDQIMLGEMGGDKAVGIYSAATRISEIWYFIPLIIASSLFPSLLRIKNENTDLFYRKFSDLFRLLTVISLCVAIPIVFLSDFVIRLLYGVQYAESASILTLHIWGGIFASLGIAQGKYWISNNLQKLQLLITVLSAIINIVLNYVFIPLFGAKGAAISTIITLSVGTILTPFIFKDARKIATITFLSLFLIPWKTKR